MFGLNDDVILEYFLKTYYARRHVELGISRGVSVRSPIVAENGVNHQLLWTAISETHSLQPVVTYRLVSIQYEVVALTWK